LINVRKFVRVNIARRTSARIPIGGDLTFGISVF
jgi:hypothetical protein